MSRSLNLPTLMRSHKIFNPLPDRLLRSFHKIDSIRQDFNLAVYTIQREYRNAVSKIDAELRQVDNFVIDKVIRSSRRICRKTILYNEGFLGF